MFEAGALIWRIQTIGKDVLKQDLAETSRAADGAGKSLGETGKKVDELGQKSNSTRPAVRGVSDEIKTMSQRGQQASREVGTTLLAVGAAVTGMAVLAVRAARDWETAWTGVVKTVSATPAELEEIEVGLRDLTKILPASHTEIAAVAEAAGQLGVRAKDIVAFTRTMVDLGETTNLTADEAATSLAQFMNIMQTAPEDVHRLGSAVVALGNNGASTERDIVQMSQRIAGAGKIIGLTEGETLGLANALASVGIEAEAGGSAVSNIMIDIANAVSQKGDKLLEWSKLAGLSADEFAEKYRTKPAEAIALVVEGLGKLNQSGGDVFSTLSSLGQTDVRVTRALLSLANSGDLLRKSLELGNQAWKEDDALQQEAQKRYETTAAKLEIARNAVNDMAIELGDHLLPIVTAGAQGVKGFAEGFTQLPDTLQGGVVVLLAVAGGVTLFSGAMFVAIPRIVMFRQAVQQINDEMPKTAGALKLATAAAVALVAVQVADALRRWADEATNATQSAQEMRLALKEGGDTAKVVEDALNGGGIAFGLMANGARNLNLLLSDAGKLSADLQGSWAGSIAEFASLGTVDTSLAATRDNLKALDTVMAELVTSGNTAQASALFKELLSKTDGSKESIKALQEYLPNYREAQLDAAKATETGTAATTDATEAYLEQNKEVQGLEQQLQSLLKVLDEGNDKNRDAITTNLDYRDTLAEIDDAIQKARDGVEGYTNTLDPNTDAGRNNQAMLVDLASKASDAAAAQLAVDGNTQNFQATLQASRDALIQRAIDLGYNSDEATRLADSILKIPSKAETDAIVRTTQAQQAIADLKASLAAFIDGQSGRTIWLNVATSYAYNSGSVGGIPQGRALGGIDYVEYMATGGIRSNFGAPAQVRRAGEVTVWAEHETGGESYIPWANDHRRPNAVAVLDRTAYELGYDIVPRNARAMAEGGSSTRELTVTSSTSAPSAPSPTVLAKTSIEELARAFAAQLRLQSRQGGTTNG